MFNNSKERRAYCSMKKEMSIDSSAYLKLIESQIGSNFQSPVCMLECSEQNMYFGESADEFVRKFVGKCS